MLKKIKDLLRPPAPTKNPFNLKDSEYIKLKEFRTHPLWETYTGFLDKMCMLLSEDMLAASDEKVVLHYRSYILGLRRAGTIVDELIRQEKAKDARELERSNRGKPNLDATKLATYGTPFWSE